MKTNIKKSTIARPLSEEEEFYYSLTHEQAENARIIYEEIYEEVEYELS